ncbi:MAG: hypothetical protein RDU20_07490 [Desulfomonilaceae bacterium]|nr:hypothetical protein [Desulfomonilaceae bacterium]
MQTGDEPITEENKRIRRLRISADLLIQYLMTHPTTQSEAEKLIEGVRGLSQALFPGTNHVFELIYMPRFRRALREAGLTARRPRLRALPGGRLREGYEPL